MRGFAFVVFALGCSSISEDDDFAIDGGVAPDQFVSTPCTTSNDCPPHSECAFPVNGGCDASSQCFAVNGACKSLPVCACDGTQTSACNGGAPVPVRSSGSCGVDDAGCAPVTCADCTEMYTPPPLLATLQSLGACTPTEIDAFVAACFSTTSSLTTCEAWQEDGDAGACNACVLGDVVDCSSGWCTLNASNCIDLELDQVSQEQSSGGAGSCGDLYSASTECGPSFCTTCTVADFDTCVAWANATECGPFITATENPSGPCAALYGDASAPHDVTKCFPEDANETVAFVNVFCGSGL